MQHSKSPAKTTQHFQPTSCLCPTQHGVAKWEKDVRLKIEQSASKWSFAIIAGEGWCSGESTHPPPMWLGVNAICGLSLVLVLSFALSDFLLGNPVFPSPQNKPTFPNPKLTRNGRQRTLHGCATHCTFKLLFIYLLILLCLWPWFPIGCFFPLELTLLATKLPNICLQCKIMDKNTWQK